MVSAPPYTRAALGLTLFIAAVIVWGSLYPFQFVLPDQAALTSRLAHATSPHMTRDDEISNVLIYMPFGAACVLLLRSRKLSRVFRAAILGSALSLSVEAAQLATAHRVTSVFDWLLNTIGSLTGATTMAMYLLIGERRRFTSLWHDRPAFVPLSLAAIWLITVFSQSLRTVYPLHAAKFLAGWLVLTEALRRIWRAPYSLAATAACAVLALGLDALHGNDAAFWLNGACAIAALISLAWPHARSRTVLVACIVAIALIVTDVWPYMVVKGVPEFQWTPFAGNLLKSRDYAPLVEKLFLYAALLWLLALRAHRLITAFALTLCLTATLSLLRLWMPQHPAEITDPLIVVALGASFRLALRFQPFALGKRFGGAKRERGSDALELRL